MFEEYYIITPHADQKITVECYSLCKDESATYIWSEHRYKPYYHFEYEGFETYSIEGNKKAWDLFYNRFVGDSNKEVSIYVTDFDLERIKEEYSGALADAKKWGYEYYEEEDANNLFDIITDSEISPYDVDECVNMWNEED